MSKLSKIENAALFDLSKTLSRALFVRFRYPFLVLPHIKEFIFNMSKTLGDDYFECGEGVFIHKTAVVSQSATILAPAVICDYAEIRTGAFIRGSALIGRGAVVGNSTEVKNAILFDNAKAPHFNYVGDSVLGHSAHLGAGAITSNVKGDGSIVEIKAFGETLSTGYKKCGAFLGDEAEIGCNAVLNPGCVVGRNARVYPLVSVRGVIDEGAIIKR